MNLTDLDRSYWVLMYRRGVVVITVIFSISLDWICFFRIFAGKVAGITTIYTEVICLVSLLFDFGQLL